MLWIVMFPSLPRSAVAQSGAGRAGFFAGAIIALVMLAGCTVPVAAGLDEGDANRIAVALDQAGLDATKEADPATEGKYRVQVARDDAASAIAVLRDEELPKAQPKGVLDAVGQGSLVPSPLAEHAQYLSGLGGDLERTLLGLDGIARARVHLNLPLESPFRDAKVPVHGSASVLIEHHGSTPPMTADSVQRLIAGGAPGLTKEDVAVVFIMRAPPANTVKDRMSHVGPFAVAKGSRTPLQLAFGGVLLGLLCLAAGCVALFSRIAKLQGQIAVNQLLGAGLQAVTPGPSQLRR